MDIPGLGSFAGLGTVAIFAAAVLVWLVYLVPLLAKRREYLATERNAVRLQQTLRVMAESAESPEEIRIEAAARQVARQQKVLQKQERLQAAIARAEAVARARELDDRIREIEQEVKVAIQGSISRKVRLRRTKMACSALLLLAIGACVAGFVVPSLGFLLVIAGVVGSLSVIGLVAVNRSSAMMARVAREAAPRVAAEVAAHERTQPQRTAAPERASARASAPQETAEHMRSRVWTPEPMPAPVSAQVAERGGFERDLAARLRAAALAEAERDGAVRQLRAETPQPAPITPAEIDEEAASADVAEPAAPSRFAQMGVLDDEVAAVDMRAAFARRVG